MRTRRAFLVGLAVTPAAARATIDTPAVASQAAKRTTTSMYGLIGRITATAGQRDALIDILLEGTGEMPGCLSYVVARDPDEVDAIWITEVWEDEASHKASLSLPAVQAAIGRGRALIAGFSHRSVTEPVGGVGLPPRGAA